MVKTTDLTARANERGAALVLSLIFTIVALGIVGAGALTLKANQKRTDTSIRLNAQASQFARAGLTEALAWFRRQTEQPVLAFDPILDAGTTPPTLDTADADVGIVREFRIGGSIWGRYEVWKEWDSDPDADRAARRSQLEVLDVSSRRGDQSAGSAWRIRSIGSIFNRFDPLKPLDEAPNVRIAARSLETEIRRLRLAPPGQAAISVSDANRLHITGNGRLLGGSKGAGAYFPQAGAPTASLLGSLTTVVTGTPALSPTTDYDDSPEAVFGLSLSDLTAIADDVVTDPDEFPNPIPDNAIIVVDVPNIRFDSSRPLRGTGAVYITGNVIMQDGSNSVFNGLLYVDGNLNMNAPSEVNGAIVCTRNVTVRGTSDFSTITYDEGVLASLRQAIGNYRLASAIRTLGPNFETF